MWQFLKDAWVIVGTGIVLLAGTWGGAFWLFPEGNLTGYVRLSDRACQSLICGTSRSAHGVVPELLDTAVQAGVWSNYSFTLATSPWSETYVNSIKEKLACSVSQHPGQCFLLFVDPWNVRGAPGQSFLDDSKVGPCRTSSIYFLLNHSDPLGLWKHAFWDPVANEVGQHFGVYRPDIRITPSGWLNAQPIPDPQAIARRTQQKLKQYSANASDGIWPNPSSEVALLGLIDEMLLEYPNATVVLVRPPVSKEFYEMEQARFPNADRQFATWANEKGIQYWNFAESENTSYCHFWDGNHLDEMGAMAFTRELVKRIQSEIIARGQY